MKQLLYVSIVLAAPFFSIAQLKEKQPKALGVTASLPWLNNYAYFDHDLQKSSFKSGFVGLGASAYYRTGKNKFSVNYGFTGDLPVPIGPYDRANEGTRTGIRSTFWEGLYHRTLFGNVNITAGLNYTKYRFDFTSFVDSLSSYSVFDKTLGITIGTEYRFNKTFALALFYRPAIIAFNQKHYRHVISLDARFDIHLWKNYKTDRTQKIRGKVRKVTDE